MLGHHRPASEKAIKMAFCWRADDGPLLVVFRSLTTKSPKKTQSWTPSEKLSGSAHVYLQKYKMLQSTFTMEENTKGAV